MGKTKTAMVSAIGPPASTYTYNAPDNPRYLYPYEAGTSPIGDSEVQVYFQNDHVNLVTVDLTHINSGNPTLGDLVKYFCSTGAEPTDIYCDPDDRHTSSAYIYFKTRLNHDLIVDATSVPELINYNKTFSTETNQYSVSSVSMNLDKWQQVNVNRFYLYGQINPGQGFMVDGSGHGSFAADKHIKIKHE